jgi:hypothetical protein
MKILSVILCGLAFMQPAFADGKWTDFKGLYVGMKSEQAKKLGLSCQPASGKAKSMSLYDELCSPAPGNTTFATLGGEKVTLMETALKDQKVIMTTVKTLGTYGGGLEKSMTTKYGKPKKAKGDWKNGNFEWDRGGSEFITLYMQNGVNEIEFAIDPTFVSQGEMQQHKSTAAKDF